MSTKIGPVIGIDGEKEFRETIRKIDLEMKTMKSELKDVTTSFDENADSMEAVSAKNKVLNSMVDKQREKFDLLKKRLEESSEKYGENSEETLRNKKAMHDAAAELNKMQSQMKKNSKAAEDMASGEKESETGARNLKNEVQKLGNELGEAGNESSTFAEVLKANLTSQAIIGGIKTISSSIKSLVTDTREYSQDLGKLKTNAEVAGMSFDTVKDNLREVTALTGESDSSIEALSNLLKVGFTDQQLTSVVNELAGAVVQFPDTLKIESLSDSLQETIASGKATGQFAELLDRLGMSSETFSEKLGKCADEGQRQQLVLDTLAKTGLADVNEKYKEINQETLEYARAQFDLNQAMTELGDAAQPIITTVASELAKLLSQIDTEVATEKIKGFMEFVGEHGSEIISIITGVGAGFVTWNVVSMISNLVGTMGTLKTALTTTTVAQEGMNVAMAANPIGIVITAVAALAAGLVTLYTTNEEFRNKVNAAWTAVKDKAVAVFTTIKEQIEKAKQQIQNAVTAIKNIPKEMKAIGKNIVTGIWDGISSGGDWLMGKIGGFKNKVVGGFKNAFGIHSPSRLMRDEVGKMLARGIGVGIDEEMPKVNRQIKMNLKSSYSDLQPINQATTDYNLVGQMAEAIVQALANAKLEIQGEVNIDGKQAGKLLSPHVSKELAFAQKKGW